MRIRTWLSRACLTGAATLTALALVAPPLAAQTEERPGSFRATAFATPIHALLNTSPQTLVEELIRVDLPHGSGTFAAGDEAFGRASSIFPGAAVEEGPGLAWGSFWGGFCAPDAFPCHEFPGLPPDAPPTWPFTTQAEHPTRPEAKPAFPGQQVGEPGDPISFTINDVKATATADGVTTTAVISNLDFIPVAGAAQSVPGVGSAANSSLLHAGKLHALTKLRFDGKVLVAEAESRLADVSLFGGAVQIEKLVAFSSSTHDGGKKLANHPRVTLDGVTVGGVPAKITHEGLVVGEEECLLTVPQVGPLCGVPKTVAEGMERLFGGRVRLIDSTDDRRQGTATGEAVGVLVSFEVDASGFPSGVGLVGDVILGTARTTDFADASSLSDIGIEVDDEFLFEDDLGFEDFGEEGTFEEFADVGGEVVVADEGDEGGELQGAPDNLTGGGRTTEARFEPLEALLRGAAADRIKLLYVAWTLALMGLALGSRLAPLRFVKHR